MASKEANEYKLERIPTFILLKDGKEVHRVVEYPNETIEKDFAMALKWESLVFVCKINSWGIICFI